jgi:uncharacterized protein (TIGR03083 family)
MRIEEYIARVRDEGERLVELLRGADLAATTPTCPEWTVAELGRHTGRIHRWAATVVRIACDHNPTPDEQEAWWGVMPADAELADWVQRGVDGLVEALTEAPPDLACWSFLPAPTPLAFWARRQVHETTIHRVDAEVAVTGKPASPVPVEVAVDGVDELLLAFFSRPNNRVRSTESRTLAITASDADAGWLLRFTPEGVRCERTATPVEQTDAAIVAPASTVYFGLWNRGDLDVTGDPEVLELWRGTANIRWSRG